MKVTDPRENTKLDTLSVLLIPSAFPTGHEPHRYSFVREYAYSLALQHKINIVYPQMLGAPGVGDRPFFSEQWLTPRVRIVNYTYSHFPKSWFLSYLLAYRQIWRRIHQEWKVDIIFAHNALPAGFGALVLGWLLRLPVILSEQMGPPQEWLDGSLYPRRLQFATLRFVYGNVTYLGPGGKKFADEIRTFFRVPVHDVLYYPVDCDSFHPGTAPTISENAGVLCVTRGGDWRKGNTNLLAAWQIVVRRGSRPAELDIVGSNLGPLASEIRAMGLGESCRLHPWKPKEELAAMMRNAALLVIPSDYETFCCAGVEAMASGLPVVATKCGGPEDYITEGTGLLVPPRNPRALADAIEMGLDRSNFLDPNELARRARQQFGYDAFCRRFTNVAISLINEGRRC